MASLTGTPSVFITKHGAHPWRDGTQYITSDWSGSRENHSTIDVFETASNNLIHHGEFDGYVKSSEPSPVDKKLAMVFWSADYDADEEWVVVDVDKMEVVAHTGAKFVDWMPDGRLMRIANDGTIRVGEVGTQGQESGHLQIPNGYVLGPVWVNHQATKIAVQLKHPVEPIGEVDIWVANIDGSGLEQFTQSKMSYEARWSPEGSYLAYNFDTGYACIGSNCMGICKTWYAPVTARGVTGLLESANERQFRIMSGRHHYEQILNCGLIDWLE
jgi:hypothetical protein